MDTKPEIKIGYQGIEGSNSEAAANEFIRRNNFSHAILIPLVCSENVIKSLSTNKIDYGVIAIRNNIGGTVLESAEALKDIPVELNDICVQKIHHCIYKKNARIPTENISKIISHIQALRQCSDYLHTVFSDAIQESYEDTAKASKMLSEGLIEETTAVICSKEAGEMYGLSPIEINIENGQRSFTEFRLLSKGKIDYTNNSKISLQLQKQYKLSKINKISIFSKILIFILVPIITTLILYTTNSVIAIYIPLLLTVLLASFFFVSEKISDDIKYSKLIGYWKYKSEAISGKDISQQHGYERIVSITLDKKGLQLQGWICGEKSSPLFISSRVLVTDNFATNGMFIYYYNSAINIQQNARIAGLVNLNWNVDSWDNEINIINGWYLGSASKEIGEVSYIRISKKEFDILKNNKFHK